MIFHTSIAVSDPERVADVLVELWGGKKFPFFPGTAGSWMVISGDDRGTLMEVHPHGHLLTADRSKRGPLRTDLPKETSTHVAIGTILTKEEVHAIGKREGWETIDMRRVGGGGFNVIELWLENAVMLEILPPDAQAEYVRSSQIAPWDADMAKKANKS